MTDIGLLSHHHSAMYFLINEEQAQQQITAFLAQYPRKRELSCNISELLLYAKIKSNNSIESRTDIMRYKSRKFLFGTNVRYYRPQYICSTIYIY